MLAKDTTHAAQAHKPSKRHRGACGGVCASHIPSRKSQHRISRLDLPPRSYSATTKSQDCPHVCSVCADGACAVACRNVEMPLCGTLTAT